MFDPWRLGQQHRSRIVLVFFVILIMALLFFIGFIEQCCGFFNYIINPLKIFFSKFFNFGKTFEEKNQNQLDDIN